MPPGIRIANPRVIFNYLAALALAAAALLAPFSAWADPPGRVGRIAQSSGTVWLFDIEQNEWVAAVRNRPLTSGDRLSAERDARAELSIGSATVRLDGGSELEITELNDDRVRLHLRNGSLALRLRSAESVREFAVTTREGRFDPLRSGHYRIDQEDNGSFAGVIAGALRFEARDSALEINAGQRAEFWSEGGVTHYSWSTLPNDRFADWVAQQDRQDERDARRRPYVSPEMTGAEDLDRYGDWDRHPEYGTLWYPRRVEPGWAPYRYGHWAYVQPWGYTWVDDAPWGFAPFHYGRWVWWQGRWAWAPGQYVARPVYAPALVAWIGGPHVSIGINIGGGPSVGWVPLSPREVYRPYYNVTNIYVTNINSPYRRWHAPERPGQPVRTGPIMYSNQGVPGGVTVVSQDVLRERRPIGSGVIAAVDPRIVQRLQTQPIQAAQPQQPGQRGNERRPQDNAPPPAPRVVAVPGATVVAVPAAPGAMRRTPWGQPTAPVRAPVHPEPDIQRAAGERQPGRLPLGDGRGERPAIAPVVPVAPVMPVAPAAPVVRAPLQERRAPGQDAGRPDLRRAAPPQAAQPVPAAQVQQPVHVVRGPGHDRDARRAQERAERPERPEREERPGQDRRRDQRQQQNQ
ncbi:MAG: hypothetical protein Q8L49_14895 [Burkholderiaceae bacterium]|nr:hypothetical protein [Burkholderiaceae bacterium]